MCAGTNTNEHLDTGPNTYSDRRHNRYASPQHLGTHLNRHTPPTNWPIDSDSGRPIPLKHKDPPGVAQRFSWAKSSVDTPIWYSNPHSETYPGTSLQIPTFDRPPSPFLSRPPFLSLPVLSWGDKSSQPYRAQGA